jgi:hypothetical protein
LFFHENYWFFLAFENFGIGGSLIMKYLRKQNCKLFFLKTYPTLLFTTYEHKGMNGNVRGCSFL